jgi:hypothetical protein
MPSTLSPNLEYIINILQYLIDNIFVMFGECVFQQKIGIPMGTNCAPLLISALKRCSIRPICFVGVHVSYIMSPLRTKGDILF